MSSLRAACRIIKWQERAESLTGCDLPHYRALAVDGIEHFSAVIVVGTSGEDARALA